MVVIPADKTSDITWSHFKGVFTSLGGEIPLPEAFFIIIIHHSSPVNYHYPILELRLDYTHHSQDVAMMITTVVPLIHITHSPLDIKHSPVKGRP